MYYLDLRPVYNDLSMYTFSSWGKLTLPPWKILTNFKKKFILGEKM